MIRMSNVWVIYSKEILDLFRDKRTVYGMIVLPIVIYPVMLILFSQVLLSQTQKLKQKKYDLVVVGAERAPGLMEKLKADPSWEVTAEPPTEEKTHDARLLEGKVEVVLVVDPDFTPAVREDRSGKVMVRYNQAKDESIFAYQRVNKVLDEYGEELLRKRLEGKPEGFERPIETIGVGVAPPEKAGGFHLGRMIAMMLVLMSAVSAFYPSVDMASGEKERGTMETLLVSPALRSEIVFGKYLAVATIAGATAILHLTSMGLTFSHFFSSTLGATGLQFKVSLGSALLVLLPLIPLTLLFSAVCLGLSAFARSYKEAMVYLTPVMIIANMTAFSALIPGIEFNYALALMPVQNCAMLTVQLLSGEYNWGLIFATAGSSAVYAFVALRWTWSIFQREDVLLRGGAEFDLKHWLKTFGTARPGIGHALGAYIAMMALQLAFSTNLARLGVRSQLFVQQLFMIALPAAVIALLTSLHFRQSFRLRAPRPLHLALAPVIAASALILMSHVFNLLDKIPYFHDTAQDYQKLMDEKITSLGPLWMTILFIAVLPGICEEFLFRGVILSGLRRDLGRVTGIVFCGALFGIVHQIPISVVAVGILGILLSWMALHSGSIFVTILAHVSWNAGLLITTRYHFELKGAAGAALTAAAALVFVASVWAFRRTPGADPEETAGAVSAS